MRRQQVRIDAVADDPEEAERAAGGVDLGGHAADVASPSSSGATSINAS